ncbi:aldolase [candidate division KSB1 bacterium]|nr:aldolase [candidate division KSB1 bacterium]
MIANDFKDAVIQRKRLYGTLVTCPMPLCSTYVASIGLDFVFIDTEHIPLDRCQLATMCHLYNSRNLAPFVRISCNDPELARQALDAGAQAIMAPYTETAAQVLELAGAVKFRPLKGERLGRAIEKGTSGHPILDQAVTQRCRDHVLFANIESQTALDHLDEILKIPYLDGIIIGPSDLSYSINLPDEYDHPAFIKVVDDIIDKAKTYKKSVGYHKGYAGKGIEQEIDWIKKGMNVIIHEADVIAFCEKMTQDISRIKNALGDFVAMDGLRQQAI